MAHETGSTTELIAEVARLRVALGKVRDSCLSTRALTPTALLPCPDAGVLVWVHGLAVKALEE